jgi:hypothetical protein
LIELGKQRERIPDDKVMEDFLRMASLSKLEEFRGWITEQTPQTKREYILSMMDSLPHLAFFNTRYINREESKTAAQRVQIIVEMLNQEISY